MPPSFSCCTFAGTSAPRCSQSEAIPATRLQNKLKLWCLYVDGVDDAVQGLKLSEMHKKNLLVCLPLLYQLLIDLSQHRAMVLCRSCVLCFGFIRGNQHLENWKPSYCDLEGFPSGVLFLCMLFNQKASLNLLLKYYILFPPGF